MLVSLISHSPYAWAFLNLFSFIIVAIQVRWSLMYIATPLEIFLKIDYFNMYIYQESYELIILYKNSLRTKMSKISETESNISSRAL